MRNKAQRRAHTERVRSNRIDKLTCSWGRDLSKKERGRLRKSNGSCGCSLCKPWKYGMDYDKKHSDRKK